MGRQSPALTETEGKGTCQLESILFWNKPPTRESIRSADPLGFDALREAMADALVPLLTGATRDADEYLWTLIGLRWSRKSTGSSVDATIFNKGFAPFERALKQYWYKFEGKPSGGITVVKTLCEGGKPELKRPILVDQRATGLLGNYIVSLRGMGLVQANSLLVVEDVADRLLTDINFSPHRSWASSWSDLKRAFCNIDFQAARGRLGNRLFGGSHDEMTRAARAILAYPKAQAWRQVPRRYLGKEQARLVEAAKPLVSLETIALSAFGEIIRGEKILSASIRRDLRSLASTLRDIDPFPSHWSPENPLRSAISDALSSLAQGREPTNVLVRLHVTVRRDVRKTEPWIRHLGHKPLGFQQWQPSQSEPDFRFKNLHRLRRQTRWRGHAS